MPSTNPSGSRATNPLESGRDRRGEEMGRKALLFSKLSSSVSGNGPQNSDMIARKQISFHLSPDRRATKSPSRKRQGSVVIVAAVPACLVDSGRQRLVDQIPHPLTPIRYHVDVAGKVDLRI